MHANSTLPSARLLLMAACCCAASLAGPSEASACACCDAEDVRTPLAWSSDGSQLLVLREDHTECHNLTAVEVWEVGAAKPKACHDIHSPDPTKAIACDDVIDLNLVENPPAQVTLKKPYRDHVLKLTGLAKTFTEPVKKARKRKDYRIKKGARDDERSFPCQAITVTAMRGKARAPLYDACVDLKPHALEFERGVFIRPTLTVWRSPNPNVFLLTASIFTDESRVYGWLLTQMHWVDLGEPAAAEGKPGGKVKKSPVGAD